MGDTSENKPKKYICIGLLAHVDAGKTTLAEAMLYECGSIRRMGRVDKGDTFLDTYEMERARGITIFSKQAVLQFANREMVLLDTPGHVDFSAEMERTLQVLDYAILVISGTDGVQGHTMTLWTLLERYHIPVFVFINKMDRESAGEEELLLELQEKLSEGCVEFGEELSAACYERIALLDERALECFLEEGKVPDEELRRLIRNRELFPCFFGSALKADGIQTFLGGLDRYMKDMVSQGEFGARIFKVSRDSQGNRLTHMKITGGSMKVKAVLSGIEEKVNQIRVYSGHKFDTLEEAEAGCICAVPGLAGTYPGMGLGAEQGGKNAVLHPVLTYRMRFPDGVDARAFFPKLLELQDEDPMLHIVWEEELQEIQVQLMGEVQLQVLASRIQAQYHVTVKFDSGSIVYKETIARTVEGVGHFEPLRHYAEVHLLMEPGEPGSGLNVTAKCSEDELDRNWQRLIVTHLLEKEHRGVQTGAAMTDMKITVVAGRAHKKHTEGGDFREATYRAVRQGLMEAGTILLEPYYEYLLEVPEQSIGRAMSDMERMCGTFRTPVTERKMAVLTGVVPAANIQGYQKEIYAYTKGMGRLSCTFHGYKTCHNAKEIVANAKYDPERDVLHPSGSIFCTHGAGINIPWYQVKQYMHIESKLTDIEERKEDGKAEEEPGMDASENWIGTEEIERILNRATNANKRDKGSAGKGRGIKKITITAPQMIMTDKPKGKCQEYLLVDGYNIIFAWDELQELADRDIDGARGRLQDILCNYQAIIGSRLILVFDAYRVQRHQEEILHYHNIEVIFTKEAVTADQYIERFAHKNKERYRVTVATSDNMEQIITRGQGCGLLSARELLCEVRRVSEQAYQDYKERQPSSGNRLFETLLEE